MYLLVWTDRVNGAFRDAWQAYETREDAQTAYDFLTEQNENLYSASICKPIISTDYEVAE